MEYEHETLLKLKEEMTDELNSEVDRWEVPSLPFSQRGTYSIADNTLIFFLNGDERDENQSVLGERVPQSTLIFTVTWAQIKAITR